MEENKTNFGNFLFRDSFKHLSDKNWKIALMIYVLTGILRIGSDSIKEYNLMTIIFIAYVLTPFLIVKKKYWGSIGIKKPTSIKYIFFGVGAIISVYISVFFALYLLFGFSNSNWTVSLAYIFKNIFELNKDTVAIVFILSIITMIMVAMCEEFFFRGILQTLLKEKCSCFGAIILTSFLWAFVHLGAYGLFPLNIPMIIGMFPSVILMGIVIGWTYEKTGSVFSAILIQATGNSVLVFLIFKLIVPGII